MIDFDTDYNFLRSENTYTPVMGQSLTMWIETSADLMSQLEMLIRVDDPKFCAWFEDGTLYTSFFRKSRKETTCSYSFAASTRYHLGFNWWNLSGAAYNTIYVNGELTDGESQTLNTPTSNYLYMGGDVVGDETWDGLMEDIRIYDRVLSLWEMADIYGCQGSDAVQRGLIHRWMLNERAMGVQVPGTYTIDDLAGDIPLRGYGTPVYAGSKLRPGRML